jgi:predicted phosphodiesterase
METQSIRNKKPSGRKIIRIAVFGDIHGDIDAYSAAHCEAAGRKVDAMYHLGDLGGYAPFVNEVVNFLATNGKEVVQGNYDEAVANDRGHCGCKYEDCAGREDILVYVIPINLQERSEWQDIYQR